MLTQEEEEMMDKLRLSFLNSDRLQKHIGFLYTDGGMYLAFNGNLLFHGCIPMEADASFSSFEIDGVNYKGKALVDEFDRVARRAYLNRNHSTETCIDLDLMWYLWCGPMSPLFGKTKMTTFERYFINDKDVQAEPRNPYYKLRDQESIVKGILTEFGLDPQTAHIVNGHTPVKVSKGENPVKANGRLYVIDGGMSIPYQKVTGIGGYTLIYNSYSIILVQHAAFESRQKAIEEDVDIISNRTVIEQRTERIRVCDTDMGNELRKQISDLHMLLTAYRKGLVKER